MRIGRPRRVFSQVLLKQLTIATGVTALATASSHANRLRTLLGLLELGLYEEAVEFLTEVVDGHWATAEQVTERVRDPLPAALLGRDARCCCGSPTPGARVPGEQQELILMEAWSTKEPPPYGQRGLGPALVHRLVHRLVERQGGVVGVGAARPSTVGDRR